MLILIPVHRSGWLTSGSCLQDSARAPALKICPNTFYIEGCTSFEHMAQIAPYLKKSKMTITFLVKAIIFPIILTNLSIFTIL